MSVLYNEWLDRNLEKINEFVVDESKETYYIHYLQTKDNVIRLNDDWNIIKSKIDVLKNNIIDLRNAIDSEEYKSRTEEIIAALDDSMNTMDNNFAKLFNSVVKRMNESAESDEWFAEVATLFASYIANGILDNNGNSSGGKSATSSSQTITIENNDLETLSSVKNESGTESYSMVNGKKASSTYRPVDEEDDSIENGTTINDDYDNSNNTNKESVTSSGATETVSPSASSSSTSTSIEPHTSEIYSEPTPSSGTGSSTEIIPSEQPTTPVVDTYSTYPTGDVDISKYNSKPESGFVVTTGNPTYNLSDSDVDLIVAIVSAESDKSYDDALAVASTILNRCEASNWVNSYGTNPVKQATAPNQFVVYQHGSYKSYLGSKAPETCRQAVLDALNGVRNHEYLSFRSNGSSGYSSNMITSTGNRYK